MARQPYLIARQEHVGDALDELTSRGVLTWRWDYDTQRHRAIYWVAQAGLREEALDTKQAERVAQAELCAMGINWLPVPTLVEKRSAKLSSATLRCCEINRATGVMDKLEELARDGCDRMIGLDLSDVAVDGCLTKAPCGGEVSGRNPTDTGKLGVKRSTMVDAGGLPLGVVSAPANRHDSPLLAPTLALLKHLGPLPPRICAHLDAGYDSHVTRGLLASLDLDAKIAHKGLPAPVQATQRWPVERVHSWHNNFYRLARCTERRQAVADFYIALANAIILVRGLIRRTWTDYRWDTRPPRRP